jgi:hypothetical protein
MDSGPASGTRYNTAGGSPLKWDSANSYWPGFSFGSWNVGSTQYWPTYNDNTVMNSVKNIPDTEVATGAQCSAALNAGNNWMGTLLSSTTGTCCLTNDLKYLGCYACFDCMKLMFSTTPPQGKRWCGCSPSLGYYTYGDWLCTPGSLVSRGYDSSSILEVYGWFSSCENTQSPANNWNVLGVTNYPQYTGTIRYQPNYNKWFGILDNKNSVTQWYTGYSAAGIPQHCVPKGG